MIVIVGFLSFVRWIYGIFWVVGLCYVIIIICITYNIYIVFLGYAFIASYIIYITLNKQNIYKHKLILYLKYTIYNTLLPIYNPSLYNTIYKNKPTPKIIKNHAN